MIKWMAKIFGYVSKKAHKREVDSMKNPYNTGELGNHLKIKKGSGNTTRILDLAVQEFFMKRRVSFDDHHKTEESRRRVLKMFLHRLQVEHGIRREDLNFSINSRGIHVSFRKR